MWSSAISMSVCLSVCMPVPTSQNFLYLLSLAVALSSYDDSAIYYVLLFCGWRPVIASVGWHQIRSYVWSILPGGGKVGGRAVRTGSEVYYRRLRCLFMIWGFVIKCSVFVFMLKPAMWCCRSCWWQKVCQRTVFILALIRMVAFVQSLMSVITNICSLSEKNFSRVSNDAFKHSCYLHILLDCRL